MTHQQAATQPLPQTRLTGGADRRRSIRHALGATGTITLNDGPAERANQLQVMVLNVSLHGVGFRSPVEFKPGARYAMRIGAGPLHLSSTFEVISSRSRPEGMWDIGGRFV